MDDIAQTTQMEFIQHISSDAEVLFSTTPDFEQAMKCLCSMLDASFLTLTTVFKDLHNVEIQFKSHLYAVGKKNSASKYFLNKFQLADCPPLVNTLLHSASSDQVMLKGELLASLIPPKFFKATSDPNDKIFMMPFISEGELIGIVSYVAEQNIDLKRKFNAAYHVLKSNFVYVYRQNKTDVTLNTYKSILDLMPQRVFWKNRESMYLGCNKAFAEDVKLSEPEQVNGLTDFELFPKQANLYREDDKRTIKGETQLIDAGAHQALINDEYLWVRTSKRPIVTKEKVVIGIVGTYDDITYLKTIQEELSNAKLELENRVEERTIELSESNRKLEVVIEKLKSTQEHLVETEKMAALGSLVAGVAHEINTPLGIALTGTSHLADLAASLQSDVNSGNLSKQKFNVKCTEIIESSDLILRNLERAAELIRSFKMIAVEHSEDKPQDVNIKRFLTDIVSTLAPKLSNKNIKVFLIGEDTLHLSIHTEIMAQIITSLIDNALVHGFDGIESGEIKISFAVKNEHLKVIVQDNGRGIHANAINKVFEPFFSGSGTEKQSGLGLGLSIVYNLITQKLNGQVQCRSKMNTFTQFIVTIPL